MNKSKFLEEWEKLITVCILVILVVPWELKLTEFLLLNNFTTCLISSVIIACVGLAPMLVWLIMGTAQLITDTPKKFYLDGRITHSDAINEMLEYVKKHQKLDGFLKSRTWINKTMSI